VCTLAVKKKIRAGFDMSDRTIPLLELREKFVKCYIWSIALYGAETGTLRKLDQKYLEMGLFGN
jgi:hypothetical protein